MPCVDVLNRGPLRVEVSPEQARESLAGCLLTQQCVQLPACVDMFLCRSCPRYRVDRTVDQSHQKSGRDSLSRDISQNQRRSVFCNVKYIAEVAAHLPGRDTLR